MVGSRLGRFLLIAGVNAVLLAVVVVAFELAFGSWFVPYVPPRSAIVDRTLTFRQALYEPHGLVTYRRDRYGLRGVRGPLEDVRLVTLGGSTTDQRFITEGATWQDVIASLTGIPFANAGIDGMSSTGHLVAVEEWLHRIPNFHPPYYLHYIGVNDAWLPSLEVPPDRSGTSSWLTFIRLHSGLVQRSARLWDRLRGAQQVRYWPIAPHQLDAVEPLPAQVDRDEIRRYVEARYKPNLRRLIELHRGHGEHVILVSQPFDPAVVRRRGDDVFFIPVVVTDRWAVAIGIVNAATEQVCRERESSCRFIDVAGKLAFEQEDFYDMVHVTPAGARKLGAFLAAELTALAATGGEFSDPITGPSARPRESGDPAAHAIGSGFPLARE